jgi:GTP-binding protein LepA
MTSEIIPILNKMDLPGAMPEEVKDQIVELIGCKREEIIAASGKTGMGVHDIFVPLLNVSPRLSAIRLHHCRP